MCFLTAFFKALVWEAFGAHQFICTAVVFVVIHLFFFVGFSSGVLACLDGYMNIAMEQTEEYVNGQLKAKYGDCFIRGNNGESIVTMMLLQYSSAFCPDFCAVFRRNIFFGQIVTRANESNSTRTMLAQIWHGIIVLRSIK